MRADRAYSTRLRASLLEQPLGRHCKQLADFGVEFAQVVDVDGARAAYERLDVVCRGLGICFRMGCQNLETILVDGHQCRVYRIDARA
jgi:hypothetical protein